MSEFRVIRFLNAYHTIHSARSIINLQVNEYLIERNMYSVPGQRFKMEPFGKTITVSNYFCKKNQS